MPIQANVTNNQITASVGETQIDVNVSGGLGPTGSAGPSGTIAVSAPITNAGTSTAAVIGLATGTGLEVTGGALAVQYGTTSSVACRGSDARLSDSREWSAPTVTQAEAEAGASTDRRAFTPLRVFQAIAAWWAGSAAKTKLDGIASGATANQTDAYLLSRANHTGTQLASTISDFSTAASAAAPVQSVAGRTGTVTLTKSDVGLSAVDNTADASKPVSTAQAAADASVASAAAADATSKANAAQAAAVQRANHTGTQTASTISDFSTAASAAAPVQSVAGRTGTVTLVKGDVGLSNVDNTSDASKPISTATQTALDGKASLSHAHTVGDIIGLSAAAASAAPVQSVNGQTGAVTIATYSLPNATTSTLGGVIVGTGLGVTSGTVSVTYGTTSGTACQGNDSRLSDARTPTTHASSHASGGSDALSLAASQITSGTVSESRLPVFLHPFLLAGM